MKTALYLRVSTGQQETDNQRLALEGWAKTHDLEIVRVYEEAESAWRDGHQRVLSEVLKDAGKGKFECLLVWSLDRLSRGGPLPVLSLVNRFSALGVKVESLQEPWTATTPGPMTDLLLSIVAWIARFESDLRSQRTLAGLERARKQGKRLGRPPGSKDKRKRRKRIARIPSWLTEFGM